MLYGMECLAAYGCQLLQRRPGIYHLRPRPRDTIHHFGNHLGVRLSHTSRTRDRHVRVPGIGSHHDPLYNLQRLEVAVVAPQNIRQFIGVTNTNVRPRPAKPTSYPPYSRSSVPAWAFLSPSPVRSHTPCPSVAPLVYITSLANAQRYPPALFRFGFLAQTAQICAMHTPVSTNAA